MLLEVVTKIKPAKPYGRKVNTAKLHCDNAGCGKVFYREINTARLYASEKHYCNLKCNSEGKVSGQMIPCARCGKPSWQKKCHSHNLKYCSRSCFHQHRNTVYYSQICSTEMCNSRITKHNKIGICAECNRAVIRKNRWIKFYKLLGNQCACCGERDQMYFEIDHVNNDGSKHRKAINKMPNIKNYEDYLNENPNGLQILCSNCNRAKARNDGKLYKPTKFTRRSIKQREVENGTVSMAY